jgi:hypothetical protein
MTRPRNPPPIPAGSTAPLADRPGPTDAQRGRATEAGLNTDSRGGPGSARAAGRSETDPPRDSGAGSEPRDGERLGTLAPSQGLAGAQGSGGGARRGTKPPSGGGRGRGA